MCTSEERKVKWHLTKRGADGRVFTVYVDSDKELGETITATAELTPDIEIVGMVKVG